MKVDFITILISVNIAFALYGHVQGVCNVCGSESKVACISETEFIYCFDGYTPSSVKGSCPSGNWCTNSPAICSNSLPSECSTNCGKCSADKRYACITETTFALCLGTDNPSSTFVDCPAGHYCQLNSQDGSFCNPTKAYASCSSNNSGPSTDQNTIDSTDPIVFCKNINRIGMFSVKSDKTCKTFIACFSIGGLYYFGRLGVCPDTTVFDENRSICVPSLLYTCPK